MIDFNDEDLFDELESDSEPECDFDVAAILRRVRKLEYKLEKQKEYKKHVELKLKLGTEKTEDAIDSLKLNILNYMKNTKKTKLSFDDVGTVSVVNQGKKDWILPSTKEGLAELSEALMELDVDSAFEIERKLSKKNLKNILENNPDIAKELEAHVKYDAVDPHLSIRKK